MKTKYLVTAFALVALSVPSFAASEWYVAKNASTNKCEVVAKKPDGKTFMEIGKVGFKTKAEAETALKSASGCKY